jgi:hypothetical protein
MTLLDHINIGLNIQTLNEIDQTRHPPSVMSKSFNSVGMFTNVLRCVLGHV